MGRQIEKMTPEEKGTHAWIYKKLVQQGAVTYAKLFDKLYLRIRDDCPFPAYMNPADGTITIDRSLDKDQICTIIRHEILHGFLKHARRMERKLAYDLGEDPDHITKGVMRKIQYLMRKYHYDFNYAADYEISNLSYTEKDKEIIRKVIYHGKTVQCLVTEDQHPDWVGYTMEEMWDELQQLRKQDEQNHVAEDDTDSFAEVGYDENNEDSIPPRPPKYPKNQNSEETEVDGGDGFEGEEQVEYGDDGDRETEQTSNKNSKNSRNSEKPKVVYGTFVDKNTFLDRNGNPVSFE